MTQTLYSQWHCEWCDAFIHDDHKEFCRGDHNSWIQLRRYVAARDDYTCRYCGHVPGEGFMDDVFGIKLHIDHVRPKSAGGRNVPWNLVAACSSCNCSKGAKISQWLSDFEAQRSDFEAAWEAAWTDGSGVFT